MKPEHQSEKLVVISDLHLWGPEDPMYRGLLRFLDEKLNAGDKLFIVGDLFDLFVGNKTVFKERYFELINRIKNLSELHVEVYYIEGNHDFQLEGLFDDYNHIKLYADKIYLEWHGKKLYFCHGDKINWKDIGYQTFRALTRNLITQCIIEAAPGFVIDRLGSTMSKASRGYHPEANDDVIKMFRNFACDKISNGYDFVIMGHSHHFDNMKFKIDQHEGQYINCGYPRKDKKYFILEKNSRFFEEKSLLEFVSPLKPILKQVKN